MSLRVLTSFVAVLTLSAGCLGEYGLTPGEDSGSMGEDGGVVGPLSIEEEFATKVAPILGGPDGKTGACGACHAVVGGAGPAFLDPRPTMLATMLSYPALIGDTPETSRIYNKGVHQGPALNSLEQPTIAGWILKYSVVKPKPVDMGVPKPIIKPFKPMMNVTNTIDLGVLDPAFAGQSVSFTAKMVGTSLQLSALKVNTAMTTGLHIVHPLFVTWDGMLNPTPDPADSFQTTDQTIFQNDSQPLGPGLLLLPDFLADDSLNLVFTILETKMGTADGGTITPVCKNVANFAANVRPNLAANNICYNCHGNGTAGLTMNAGLTDTALCNNVRLAIDTATPASSRLLNKPNPAVADGHPRKMAAGAEYDGFAASVNAWINLEK